MNYLKIALYVGLFAIGFGVAWSWQGARLDAVKTELKVCKEANVENQKSISNLQGEVAKSNKTCEARLRSKDRALRELKAIDGLKGTKDEKGNITPDDPILLRLDGLFGDSND
jgi:hypothetical protein